MRNATANQVNNLLVAKAFSLDASELHQRLAFRVLHRAAQHISDMEYFEETGRKSMILRGPSSVAQMIRAGVL
jgi:hypothetical protein